MTDIDPDTRRQVVAVMAAAMRKSNDVSPADAVRMAAKLVDREISGKGTTDLADEDDDGSVGLLELANSYEPPKLSLWRRLFG